MTSTATTQRATTTWNIDPTHTGVELAVKHMMFTTVRGRFKDVKGTIVIDQAEPERSKIDVEIAASTLDTGVADRDAHLRSADFLDVEQFPALTFRSRKVEGSLKNAGDKFRVTGDLTIRGVSKEVTLEGVFEGTGKDPWGGTRAGARAETKIDRRDWGLVWNQALETGGILVGNDVRIELEVQAVLQS
jgi:polyisoprenoid-binding protein YceI